VAAGPPILEDAAELVPILKIDDAKIVEFAVGVGAGGLLPARRLLLSRFVRLARRRLLLLLDLLVRGGGGFTRCLGLLVLRLEEVAPGVLVLDVAVALIVDEHAVELARVCEEDAPAADPLIVLPLAVVEISVFVVVDACSVPQPILEVSFVELPVLHQNLDLAVHNPIAVKSRLNDFVRQSEQDAVALRLIISPLATVDGARQPKLTNASAIAQPILKVAFVYVSIGVDKLSVPVADPLANSTLINRVFDSFQFISSLADKGVPMARTSLHDDILVACKLVNRELSLELGIHPLRIHLITLDLHLSVLVVEVDEFLDSDSVALEWLHLYCAVCDLALWLPGELSRTAAHLCLL